MQYILAALAPSPPTRPRLSLPLPSSPCAWSPAITGRCHGALSRGAVTGRCHASLRLSPCAVAGRAGGHHGDQPFIIPARKSGVEKISSFALAYKQILWSLQCARQIVYYSSEQNESIESEGEQGSPSRARRAAAARRASRAPFAPSSSLQASSRLPVRPVEVEGVHLRRIEGGGGGEPERACGL